MYHLLFSPVENAANISVLLSLNWTLMFQVAWLCTLSLTLIQPVCDAVEDDPLMSRRREPPRAALNVCLVVNVVFKYIQLWDREKYEREKKQLENNATNCEKYSVL